MNSIGANPFQNLRFEAGLGSQGGASVGGSAAASGGGADPSGGAAAVHAGVQGDLSNPAAPTSLGIGRKLDISG